MSDIDETEYRSFPLVDNTIAPQGLPNPYGSAQDTRTEDITQLHHLPQQETVDDETAEEIQAEYLELRPTAETPRYTPEKQIFPFATIVAVDANIDIPFKAQAIRIDNLTSQWIFLLQFRRWLPPFWYGAVFQATGVSSVTIIFQSPPGITQPAAVANGTVIGIAHSERLVEVDGEGLAGTGGTALAAQVQGVAADGTAVGAINPVLIAGFDGANIQTLLTSLAGRMLIGTNNASIPDGFATAGGGIPDQNDVVRPLSAYQYIYDGTTALYNKLRTPATFKTITLTAAGATAVWTPAAGKKFRLMRYRFDITGQATLAAAGNLEVTFLDAATALNIGSSVFIPNAAVANAFGAYSSPWHDIGNGYLSIAANNILNINLSAALTAGELRVQVCGTEE